MEEIKVQLQRFNGADYDRLIPNSARSCEWAENAEKSDNATNATNGAYDGKGNKIDTSYLAFGGYLDLTKDAADEKTFQIPAKGLYSITIIEDMTTAGDKKNRKNILLAIEDLTKNIDNQATITITYNGTRTYNVGYFATSTNYDSQTLLVRQSSGSKAWYVTCRAVALWG